MGFFSQIKGPVNSVLSKLFSDPDLQRKITYKRYLSQQFDSNLKRTVATYDETEHFVIRMKHTTDSIKTSSVSDVEIGDALFLLWSQDAPDETLMSKKDRIFDQRDNTMYKVKGFDPIHGLAISVSVEGG